jgi:outer membrane protein assembly factor BamB
VQWTAVLAADGAFVSSPAYSSGVVYAVTSEEGDGLHAVSAAAGTELWKAPTTLAGLFPGAPTVAQGSFYAVYDDLLVLDPATGHVRWIRESVGCFVCSPAVANGTLYIGGGPAVGRRLLALDAVTGVERWSFKPQVVGDFDWNGSPAVADDTVYIAGWATRTQAQRRKAYSLSAFDAGSGERRWKVPVGSSRYITGSSPAVAHGIVYYASPSTGLYALRTRDGKRLWKAAIGLTDGSPAVANGVVYVGARHGVSAFGAASGKRLWSASGPADFNPPVVVNGSLYAASSDGRLHAYRLRPRR